MCQESRASLIEGHSQESCKNPVRIPQWIPKCLSTAYIRSNLIDCATMLQESQRIFKTNPKESQRIWNISEYLKDSQILFKESPRILKNPQRIQKNLRSKNLPRIPRESPENPQISFNHIHKIKSDVIIVQQCSKNLKESQRIFKEISKNLQKKISKNLKES